MKESILKLLDRLLIQSDIDASTVSSYDTIPCVQIEVSDSWGFTEITYPILKQVMFFHDPEGFELLNPSPVKLLFRIENDGLRRATLTFEAISKLIENNQEFEETVVRLGITKNRASFDKVGKVKYLYPEMFKTSDKVILYRKGMNDPDQHIS